MHPETVEEHIKRIEASLQREAVTAIPATAVAAAVPEEAHAPEDFCGCGRLKGKKHGRCWFVREQALQKHAKEAKAQQKTVKKAKKMKAVAKASKNGHRAKTITAKEPLFTWAQVEKLANLRVDILDLERRHDLLTRELQEELLNAVKH